MNATGCPENWATDGAFQPSVEGACDTTVIGFYVYSVLLSAGLKLVSTAKQFQNWAARSSHSSSFPKGPVNSLLFGIDQIILAVLIGYDVINYKNGFSFSVFSLAFMHFVWSYSVGLTRLVSLGEKILPMSSRGGSAHLATFDRFGKTLFTVQTIFACSSSFLLIILSPVITEHELIISRIGFGSKGMFMAFCIAGYVYQFERCIKTIRAIDSRAKLIRKDDGADSSSNAANGTENSTSKNRSDMDKVIWKMRGNQLVHLFAGGPPSVIFLLLAAGVLPANVWIIFLIPLFESIGSICMEFNVRSQGRRKAGGGGPSKAKSKDALDHGMAKQLQVAVEPSGIDEEEHATSVQAAKTEGASRA